MYDAGDFKFLATITSPPGQVWMGGDFVAADCVLVWTRVRFNSSLLYAKMKGRQFNNCIKKF